MAGCVSAWDMAFSPTKYHGENATVDYGAVQYNRLNQKRQASGLDATNKNPQYRHTLMFQEPVDCIKVFGLFFGPRLGWDWLTGFAPVRLGYLEPDLNRYEIKK